MNTFDTKKAKKSMLITFFCCSETKNVLMANIKVGPNFLNIQFLPHNLLKKNTSKHVQLYNYGVFYSNMIRVKLHATRQYYSTTFYDVTE